MLKEVSLKIINTLLCLIIFVPISGCSNKTEEPVPVNEIVDLTSMSSTAVYAEVFDMMYYPEKYIGKTIKMEGIYSDYCNQATGNHYFACIIMDATACCSQGIEFIPSDDYKYPNDYPQEGDTIIVEGVFDTYTEESRMYCTLRNASIQSCDLSPENYSPIVKDPLKFF
jgi:hypothetical protein